MKKFMQVGLFMGTFLLGSQVFGQTVDKRGEHPVCPPKTTKSDAPKQGQRVAKPVTMHRISSQKAAVLARKEKH